MHLSIRPIRVLEKDEDSGTTLYRGVIETTNSSVLVRESMFPSLEEANSAVREAMLMAKLKHPGVCEVYDCSLESAEDSVKSVLVAETLDMTLSDLIKVRQEGAPFTEEELMHTLRQLVSALCFMQQHSASHRDIRPQNVFCSRDVSIVKMGQFLFAKSHSGNISRSIVGAPLYLSPQLKRMYLSLLRGSMEGSYNPYKSDVYSLGMVLLHMARLRPPEELVNLSDLPKVTTNVLRELTAYPTLVKLLRDMLEEPEELRPDFVELEERLQQVRGMQVQCRDDTDNGGLHLPPQRLEPSEGPNSPAQKTEEITTEKPTSPQKEECAFCPASLSGGVPLPCGHGFHSTDCLMNYVLESSNNFVSAAPQCCPKCKEPLPADFASGVLGRELEERRREVQAQVCCVCGSYLVFKPLPCRHLTCILHEPSEEVCHFCPGAR